MARLLLEHLAGIDDGLSSRFVEIDQLDAFMIDKLDAIVNMKKEAWHGELHQCGRSHNRACESWLPYTNGFGQSAAAPAVAAVDASLPRSAFLRDRPSHIADTVAFTTHGLDTSRGLFANHPYHVEVERCFGSQLDVFGL